MAGQQGGGPGALFGHDCGVDEGSCTTYMYTIVASHREFFERMIVQGGQTGYAWWKSAGDAYFEEFCKVVSTYQEQPHLLDVVLERLVDVLSSCIMDCIRGIHDSKDDTVVVLGYVCRFLWKLSSVRGYKTIVRCLPTDVYCVEPLFRFLERERHQTWECEYCVLMWSHHLALIPFHFDVIDSDTQNGHVSMVDALLQVCKERLYSSSTVREMAAVCLGRLLTRPDMTESLHGFGEWARDILECHDTHTQQQFIVPGVMLTMATILKIGKPTDETIRSLASIFIPIAVELSESTVFERNQLVRTLSMKIIQRSALIYILGHDVEQEAVQEALGVAVDSLLTGLNDKDTVVRWSSAKGIARIASKLDPSFVTEMVGTLLGMMKSPVASENMWHGGCLALAEMTRRNVVVGAILPELVPIIQDGLVYDVRRGYSSVGTNVRDSASYVCWALARTQAKKDMSVAFQHLAPVLMACACYDREINCRRAAAAAFQECVGRLGDVPHGIDLLTIADFFSVSLRTSAYLDVAPQVASFPGYHSVLANHLLEKKLVHWDISVRELAGQALAALVRVNVDFHRNVSIPHLIHQCESSTIVENRHGAVVALAYTLPELLTCGKEIDWLQPEMQQKVAGILPMLVEAGVTKGIGAEAMRGALCRLIQSISDVKIPLGPHELTCIYAVCRENLSHPSEDVQKDAANALSRFLDVYARDSESGPLKISVIVDEFLQDLHPSLNYGARRGAALACGKFPAWLIAQYPSIFDAMLTSLHVGDTTAVSDVESRVYAIQTLPHILDSMTDGGMLLDKVLDSLLVSLEDYSSDNRGDIGSWVRDAAANSGVDILCAYRGKLLEPRVLRKARLVLCKVVRLTLERIGRVRLSAGKCLKRCSEMFTNSFCDVDAVLEAVNGISDDDFLDGKAKLISCCTARDTMLLKELVTGAIYAIGGLDVSLQEATSEQLVAFLEHADEETRFVFRDTVLSVWDDAVGSSGRLSIPWIHTVDILLSRTACIEDKEFISKSIQCVERMMQGSGDVPKLCKIAELLGTISGEDVGSPTNLSATSLLIRLMGKKYPTVRKIAAEQLYTAMLMWDEEQMPNCMEACGILEATSWQGQACIVRPAREQVCALLGIPLS